MPKLFPILARHVADATPQIPDGEFLRRFVEDRDEDAFAELVRRNGPIVLRACRSVLRDQTAADDAFQAVFLQLARHANRLTDTPSLAGWLHTVAVRSAGAIRRSETRRRRHEQQTPLPQNPENLSWCEVREAIDAELARLPEKYRLPLLLCYIEGLTYSDAAARLGCPLGTLRGRLERGRQALRRRLHARGLPIVAITLGAGACPVVSAGIHERTMSAVRALGEGSKGLANWVVLAHPRHILLAGCAAVLVAIGIGLGAFPHSNDPPKDPSPAVPSSHADANSATPDSPRDVFGDPLPKWAVARLGTERFLQYSRDFALSPDGKTIAVSDVVGERLILLDAVTGRELRHKASVGVGCDYTFPGQEGGFTTPGIFWRPDGHGVALVGRSPRDKYLWDFTDPKDVPPAESRTEVLPPKPPEDAVACASVSADGKWLAVARQSADSSRQVVQVYPCKTGKHLRELKPERTLGPFPTASERIWFAANDRELILARADRTVIAIDAANGKERRRVTLPKWAVIATSPDGKSVAIVPRHPERDVWHTGEETARVWDLTTGKEVWKFPRPGTSISGLAFTPDSKHLITTDSEFDFRKWDLASGKETLRQPYSGYESMSVVAVSADGKRYATARTAKAIKVWDAGTGTHVNPLPTHQDAIAGVAVSSDSRLVATVAYDGTLRVWQTKSGKQICTIEAPRKNPRGNVYGIRRGVAFTPDGRGVIFDMAGVLSMADPAAGKILALPSGLKGLTGAVGGFSADGKTLVTFSGNAATLWDWPTGTPRQTVEVALDPKRPEAPPAKTPYMPFTVNTTLSPDGGTLFIISDQQTVPDGGWGVPNSTECWDVKTKRRYRFAPDLWYPRLAFSPDGRTLFAGGQPTDAEGQHGRVRRDGLAAWDVGTGTIIRRFEDPLYEPMDVRNVRHVEAVALSPDGRLLAVSEGEGVQCIWIYETASGRVVRRFEGHGTYTYGLAFTPDGSKLVSVSHDHTGLVWDITLPTFTDRKVGPLTPKEQADAWNRLAAPDPALAWRSMADLAGSSTEAVALLADRLRPPPVPTAAVLDRIEKELEAPLNEDREKASSELDAFGPNAVAPVKARLKATQSAEVSMRFQEFLKRHAGERPSSLVLRGIRGVAILEAIGSPEARKLLTRIARDYPGDPLGVEAAAAVARLEKLGQK